MPSPSAAFLAGGGAMGARMRAFDWSTTVLGAPGQWPSSLKAAVRVMLTSRFAMWMAAGPDLTFFCNDAYLPTTGDKRDWVLGARSDKVWAEIWPDIGPRIERVLKTGEATWDEALLLYLERSGFAEETYHTFSYSPLDDDAGMPNGILCVVAEVTEKIIGERQLAMLRDLGSRLAAAATRAEVMQAFEASLAAAVHDLPFALAYLIDPATDVARLVALHGLTREAPLAALHIEPNAQASLWPIAKVLDGSAEMVEVAPASLAPMKRLSSSARVLVVDDDQIVLEMLVRELQELGYETTPASDGLAALAYLDRGEKVDLLITDLSMPGMNGAILTQEARQRRASLPVMLLTGYADSGLAVDLEMMRNEGVVLLRKPVVGQELARHATELLMAGA